MRKSTNPVQKEKLPLEPKLKWQTGDYERHTEFNLTLPYPFLLLCRLMDITPEQMVRDFMDNLSCGSWNRQGRDKAKEHLINYFIEHGYGQHYYKEDDVREIFKEMDAIGLLFPNNGNSKMVDLYAKWRDKHQTYWFKQWFRKPRRKPSNKASTVKGV
ncbi:hypothetical protein [Agriterribacter humi]|jgi:hypothetical protein|uniref:hypothetical protein n=1 Tax=Agriterribacter humi TaxID=1104781 RepID=UPI00126421AB|nr:hypothetical protein [Agriterribacter humi]